MLIWTFEEVTQCIDCTKRNESGASGITKGANSSNFFKTPYGFSILNTLIVNPAKCEDHSNIKQLNQSTFSIFFITP
jgi:hypothetical protein